MNLFWHFLQNEIRLARRSRGVGLALAFFCLVLSLLFYFGLNDLLSNRLRLILPLVWLSSIFGGILRMLRTYESEERGHVWDMLRLCPHISTPFFLSKWVLNLFYILLLQWLTLVFLVMFFNLHLSWGFILPIMKIAFFGALGFVSLGSLVSALTVEHNRRDLLFPLVLYPLLIPLIIGVIQTPLFAGAVFVGTHEIWFRLVVGYSIILFVASVLLFDLFFEG